MNEKNKNMLRAGQLARLAGVSLPTVKHYVNEGLIPKPVKTGKTMAYYDESCVERIKKIKELQKEKFLPLDVIRRVLDTGETYEQELELGRALLKSYKIPTETRLISAARIERHTGFTLQKIHVLEREGLVVPIVTDGVKHYDPIDCEIIRIVRRREELGLPFAHSIETLRLYRDAITNAVKGDIRLFARNLLGDASTRQTIKFLTEVDDTLDNFMLLYRQKMLSSFTQTALAQMNELPAHLDMISFLPLEIPELPEPPPDDPELRIAYFFLTGACDSLIETIKESPRGGYQSSRFAALIAATLLSGDSRTALRLTRQNIPRPSARLLDNAAAGLAYMFSIGEASGFSDPMFLAKRGLQYFRRIETSRMNAGLRGLLARYVCGAVYIILPDVFDTCERGIRMLTKIDASLARRNTTEGELPLWLANTIDHEMLPAIEVRINRFLAEGNIRIGKTASAQRHLARLIEMADIEDRHSEWARLKALELGCGATS